ncbi:bifunctional serine/threonine-protein kinase/ABC transporter substrate-binding protein [Streptomyces antibioticus]|uniref:ABC transporter substrate-binding protein n=1 Tax=Streptomyces antibioticus TaxID=1890 RepID=A0AAE7CNK2_STRAT|nr:bifunctional serine/threonine-protein kinase/ABC transporter substrate-binding protein [Streptomyces antibioticus]OOQ47502.1 serine/threonine protein kinase [Streptomyces antibioticus]QIT47825.1 ABC transporter substrate-binding protein [Streptomyces antibioticus]
MTEPLLATDPARIAGHRLLGRLGAGGMGVVYLARSPGGTLVALKVIQAEYAEDGAFRERFRREADAARRTDSPWVAGLVDAGPGAVQPWLATVFVPGPSLAEAIAAHGPLPVRSLRVLGARLAEALRELHAAGLVHRDVKPGNVLLAPDGPRLIDFGVARGPEDTSLTSTGVVVGTPGYLPPEQAGGGVEPVPAGDVFSLGCVLAHAATGRPPFGTGAADGLLYRTAHDAPDLEGLPAELAEVVGRCLAKEPARRPTADDLADLLGRPTTGTPMPDPRVAWRADADGTAVPEERATDDGWLPEPLVRLIAERSAASLALPGVDDTEVDAEGKAGGPLRRRFLLLGVGAAAVAVGGGAALWAALSDGDGGTGGASASGKPVRTIGLHADLSGDQRTVGRAQERGLRLAVAEFNADARRPFTLAVRTVDDGGDPGRSRAAAAELVADRSVLAVIGATTDATTLASLATYDAASLPLIAVAPGGSALGAAGSRSFLQARVTDTVLPFYLDVYLRGTAGSRSVGIIDDRAADAYAWEISSTLTRIRQKGRLPAVPKVVSALRSDFGPALDAFAEGGADSVVFAGYHDRAALLARELTGRGFRGARTAAEGVLDARFLSAAGDAAEGWVIVATVMDSAAASAAPGAKAFSAAHRERYGAPPEPYAVETYDVARMVAGRLVALGAGKAARPGLATALRSAGYEGITKKFAFDAKTGTLVIDGTGVHLWKVVGGRFAYQGVAPFQVSA